MANKIKYPFVNMIVGEFKRLHFSKQKDAARAQMVCHNNGRLKGWKFETRVINFMLEVTRLK